MTSAQVFRDQLSELIDLLGYSQREIADHCQVSQQSVSRWRSGASVPTPERVAELQPVLAGLEETARARWRASPAPLPVKLARFLRDRRLDPALTELFPPEGDHQPVVAFNSDYQGLADDLVSRVPLLVATVPLGHGISTLARYAEHRIRGAMADVVCLRLSVEQLTAVQSPSETTEREAYRSLFYGLYDPAGEVVVPPHSVEVVGAEEVQSAVSELIRRRVQEELRREDYRRILGSSNHASVVDALDESDDGWREALRIAGGSAQVTVILDLSPSPGGRSYELRRDEPAAGHQERVQAMVDAAAGELAGTPRLSFLVLRPEGDMSNLKPLEDCTGAASWEEFPAPPPLQRGDFFEILAVSTGSSRLELEAAIEPRFAPDLLDRGIASTNWELAAKLKAVLSLEIDNAGVVQERDLSHSDSHLLGRITSLERQVHEIHETLQHILDAVGDLRRASGGSR